MDMRAEGRAAAESAVEQMADGGRVGPIPLPGEYDLIRAALGRPMTDEEEGGFEAAYRDRLEEIREEEEGEEVSWRELRTDEGEPLTPAQAREMRDTRGIYGVFLAREEGQDEEDASEWGPAYEAISWEGLDAAE